jgi:UDP-N-acetylglucosamine:LPS N-acetylglucosamine transferase
MILRPAFYQPRTEDRTLERLRLGLTPELPTGLVLFGGEGSNAMYSIAEHLGNSAADMQLILICGRNTKLQRRLSTLRTRNKLHVEGFTKEIPYFMNLCDFFIGKPGPGSISEAVKMNLPIIVQRNAWTLPQERYNAQWVREQGVGIMLPNFGQIESAVRELLMPARFTSMKEKISKLDNQAAFEVPRLLKRILELEHGA